MPVYTSYTGINGMIFCFTVGNSSLTAKNKNRKFWYFIKNRPRRLAAL